MLKYKFIRIVFWCSVAVLAAIDFWLTIPFAYYLFLIAAYWSINFLGAYFIQWNYFFDSQNHGSRATKKIAITFDDAPHSTYTSNVLDILHQHKIKSAFFLIGKQLRGNESIVQRIIKDGHLIGNHSFSHVNSFPFFDKQKMINDVEQCASEIERIVGFKPKLFRPPFGVTNPTIAEVVSTLGYNSIGWSLRSYDTSISNPDKLLKRCLVNLRGGDVVLFHDWGKHTIAILPKWIEAVKAKGFEIVPLDEMLTLHNMK